MHLVCSTTTPTIIVAMALVLVLSLCLPINYAQAITIFLLYCSMGEQRGEATVIVGAAFIEDRFWSVLDIKL